jgi:hypothetical protein
MNTLNGELQSHGMWSYVPRPTVVVVLVKPRETKEQAWRRHLKENPQDLCAEVKIFHVASITSPKPCLLSK